MAGKIIYLNLESKVVEGRKDDKRNSGDKKANLRSYSLLIHMAVSFPQKAWYILRARKEFIEYHACVRKYVYVKMMTLPGSWGH